MLRYPQLDQIMSADSEKYNANLDKLNIRVYKIIEQFENINYFEKIYLICINILNLFEYFEYIEKIYLKLYKYIYILTASLVFITGLQVHIGCGLRIADILSTIVMSTSPLQGSI